MAIDDLANELTAQRVISTLAQCRLPYAISANMLDAGHGLGLSDGAGNLQWSTTWALSPHAKWAPSYDCTAFSTKARGFLSRRAGVVPGAQWRRVAIVFVPDVPADRFRGGGEYLEHSHATLAWPSDAPSRGDYAYCAITAEELEEFCALYRV